MTADSRAEVEGLRGELEGARRELAACRADLGEAYSMLAKAGLDWAKERQEKAALQAHFDEVTSAYARCRKESEQLASSLEDARAEGVHMAALVRQNIEEQLCKAGLSWQEERRERERLSDQCEAAATALREEQQRRENMENMAVAVLKMAFEAKQEAESEQQLRQNAEDAAVAVLKWVVAEREGIQAEQERQAQERKELELAHGWREYNVRVKLHEAQVELLERVDKIETLERAVSERLEQRGFGPLWSEDEERLLRLALASLRAPFSADQEEVVVGEERCGEVESPAATRLWCEVHHGCSEREREQCSTSWEKSGSDGLQASTEEMEEMESEAETMHAAMAPPRLRRLAEGEEARPASEPPSSGRPMPQLEPARAGQDTSVHRRYTDSPETVHQYAASMLGADLVLPARLRLQALGAPRPEVSEGAMSLQFLKLEDVAATSDTPSQSSQSTLPLTDDSTHEFAFDTSSSAAEDHPGVDLGGHWGEEGKNQFNPGRRDLPQLEGRRRKTSRLGASRPGSQQS